MRRTCISRMAVAAPAAVASFLSLLAARTPELCVSVIGRSLPTDEYGARRPFRDTPLCREGRSAGRPLHAREALTR